MELAPIVLFAYNRPSHLERTLEALSNNELADRSTLYIYCDGPESSASEEQRTLIDDVRTVARKKQWCAEVHIIETEQNKGLAASIVGGVTEVVNRHGRVIVLEDDIITSTGFLRFMNDALNLYADDHKVMHVSAYFYPHKKRLPETFFFEVPYPGGGWATWERAWRHYDDDTEHHYERWSKDWQTFNKYGGTVLQKQLEANHGGTLRTWFIKWHSTVLQMGGLTLYPYWSLTHNIGFDSSATNCCVTTKFDILHPAEHVSVKRIPLVENRRAAGVVHVFYQGHWYSRRHREALAAKIRSMFTR